MEHDPLALHLLTARVRQARLAKNISQAEMAQRLRISLRGYQNFEKNGSLPFVKFLMLMGILDRENELQNLLVLSDRPKTLKEFMATPKVRQRARKKATA